MSTRTQPIIEVRARAGLVLGMPPARFLRDYWQKAPLLIRGAFPAFADPLTPNDLAGLACEELALARLVVHEPRRDRWTLRNGPFAEADFGRLPKRDWTLLVQDVDKWDADVAALLDRFSFLPSWRIDDVMVSYAVAGGSVGAHLDRYDVFLLQGLGRRRWRISADPDAPTDFRDDAELKLLRSFAPTHEWTLEPGDMLYLPPGVPHHGVALGECLTYSIGMRAPSQAELLLDFAESFAETLPEESRYADPDLAPARADGEIDDAAIDRALGAMPWLRVVPGAHRKHERNVGGPSGAIDTSMLRMMFGRFVTSYRSAHTALPRRRPIDDAALDRARGRGMIAVRNPWSRAAFTRDANGAILFVAGADHRCSLTFARLACGRTGIALDAVRSERDRTVLRTLIDAGHYALAAPARERRKR